MTTRKLIFFVFVSAMITSCASQPKHNHEMLEKYPKCHHINVKISNKCIEKNEAGNPVTAVELENTAYPGQYK